MEFSVTPRSLLDSSRALRRSAFGMRTCPGDASAALREIGAGVGDSECAGLAFALARTWGSALTALAGGADDLAGGTAGAGTAYATTETVISGLVGTAS